MNFDEWVMLIDTAHHHARGIRERLNALSERGGALSPGEIAALERLCRRLLEAAPSQIVRTRPEDVMRYEWDADPYAILRSRLDTLQAIATERTAHIDAWMHDLGVAVDDYIEGWAWFDSRIER